MAITVGGTSITFNDGTTQTTAAGGAPTTAQVLSATAGATAGEVGTYALAAAVNSSGSQAFNGTTSGSNLRQIGVGNFVSSSNYVYPGNGGYQAGGAGANTLVVMRGGSTLSGTWRCMGITSNTSFNICGNNYFSTYGTLWLRIS